MLNINGREFKMSNELPLSLVSEERIAELVKEAEQELMDLQPEVEYLEDCISKLQILREKETKLKTLILSMKRLIDVNLIDVTNSIDAISNVKNQVPANDNFSNDVQRNNEDKNDVGRKHFYPDKAISDVKNLLRTKNNLNYEIFKAVVINSGIATTEQIKSFLIENNIKQPQSGKGFEAVELKEISSRANYLVRKNILSTIGAGLFKSELGWENDSII